MSNVIKITSNVIKTTSNNDYDPDILETRFDCDSEAEGFTSYDSLWQSKDSESDPLVRAQESRDRILRQAEDVLAQAEAAATRIEQEAREKGFMEGKQEALIQEKKSLAVKMAQVDNLIRAIEGQRQGICDQYEHDLIELVKMMVMKVINHEVSVNPLVIPACLKKALSYVVENSFVKVHLNSGDFVRVREASLENPDLLKGFEQIELIEDPAISQGGCLLETDFGEVDATLEDRTEKLIAALDSFFIKTLAEV